MTLTLTLCRLVVVLESAAGQWPAVVTEAVKHYLSTCYTCQVALHQVEGSSVGCPHPTPHPDESTTTEVSW